MKSLISMITFRNRCFVEHATIYRTYCSIYSSTQASASREKIHPYKNIHPWKSEIEFADDLIDNVIYNADGIIAVNKPYGVSVTNKAIGKTNVAASKCHKIVEETNYTIHNVIPYIAQKLNIPTLIPCIGAEKYMSGIYVFGVNDNLCNLILKASQRANYYRKYKKYWSVTIRVPNEIKGSYHIGLTLQESLGNKKPVLLTTWSHNSVKKDLVKIMNINYKVLSNSTHNLSSLIEFEASTKKWHSLRLFAATMLYSPLLGDNYHGSRAQEIMGTWIRVNPFAESCLDMPKINPQLLELLNLTKRQQEIIPVHSHLKTMHLDFGAKKKDITLEAPLRDPFHWTCKQLMFKNVPCETNHESSEEKADVCI